MYDFETTNKVWSRAKSLKDLSELTVQWLEGKLECHFSQPSEPDEETSEISAYLIQINQLGLLTEFSQPAKKLNDGSGQRACISGFSDEANAKKLVKLNLHTDMLVFIFAPGSLSSQISYGYQIPVTVEEYHPFTWCGSVSGHEMESFEELQLLGTDALTSIVESWYVIAIDTKWGRKSYLWDNLVKTLSDKMDSNNKYFAKPYPNHGLDVDFVC